MRVKQADFILDPDMFCQMPPNHFLSQEIHEQSCTTCKQASFSPPFRMWQVQSLQLWFQTVELQVERSQTLTPALVRHKHTTR